MPVKRCLTFIIEGMALKNGMLFASKNFYYVICQQKFLLGLFENVFTYFSQKGCGSKRYEIML